jgi:nitroreductase
VDVDELLTTTRTVRRRLDFDRPVSRQVVEECLQLAFQAPNGSNLQRYSWIIVDDAATKAAMGDIYRGAMADEIADSRAKAVGMAQPLPSIYPVGAAQDKITASVMYLHDNIERAPMLVVPTVRGRLDNASIFSQASRWGSVLPTVWSFMLALRSRGLGSAWTTTHLRREADMAELLGIPFERATQAGLFPVAYTIGTEFRAADRTASAATIRWNHW